jgi:hypothetical protein
MKNKNLTPIDHQKNTPKPHGDCYEFHRQPAAQPTT